MAGVNQIDYTIVIQIGGILGAASHRVCRHFPGLSCEIFAGELDFVCRFKEADSRSANSRAHFLNEIASQHMLRELHGKLSFIQWKVSFIYAKTLSEVNAKAIAGTTNPRVTTTTAYLITAWSPTVGLAEGPSRRNRVPGEALLVPVLGSMNRLRAISQPDRVSSGSGEGSGCRLRSRGAKRSHR